MDFKNFHLDGWRAQRGKKERKDGGGKWREGEGGGKKENSKSSESEEKREKRRKDVTWFESFDFVASSKMSKCRVLRYRASSKFKEIRKSWQEPVKR